MLEKISNIVNKTDTVYGKVFTAAIQVLVIISIASFTIGTLPKISSETADLLRKIEIFTVTIFTLEYIIRIFAAKKKLAFIFSFYGLIDLLAIAPFYIASGLDLRAVRIFRLLRLIRILKLFRYSKAINRFHRAIIIAKEELILFSFVALITIYLSAVGIYYFENEVQPDQFQSVVHSLWWAVTTLTTVGYGDMFPITAGGKFFTFIVLMVGLGLVAIPTGLVASALSQARDEQNERLKENHKD